MSQFNKRSAESAFHGEVNHPPAKKKQKSASKPQASSQRRSLEHRISAPDPTAQAIVTLSPTTSKSSKKKQKRTHSSQRLSDKHHENKSLSRVKHGWHASAASGGAFLDHDPVLSLDGEFVILPTQDQIQVYSTSTSLLVRSINTKEKGAITGCSISTSKSDLIFTTTAHGALMQHNLATGSKMRQWKVEPGIQCVNVVSQNGSIEQVLVVKHVDGTDDEVAVVTLHSEGKPEYKTLLRRPRILPSVVAAPDASVIVACSSGTIHLAVQQADNPTDYTWYEMSLPGLISSFDARIIQEEKNKTKGRNSVDVVIGLDNGAILLFPDLLLRLTKTAKGGQKVDLGGRKLHWHRSSVKSVKWSKDGNYIISGGDETVLVIWQLDTNQQQFLPHLATSILGITVSSTGSSYALRLGDNSVMILSTADLLPSTNITGLSLSRQVLGIPMVLHPVHANRLLAAVSIRPSSNTATHLQTYDIGANLQLSRQALTRNLTTTINVSPYGTLIQEPTITNMQISSDGRWLATIDKWAPNYADVAALYLKEKNPMYRQSLVETVLRFWSWNEDDGSWEMVTRVDEAHSATRNGILGLVANPRSQEFCTVSEDGCVKIWQPKRRVRDGAQVRDKSGQPLSTWTCTWSMQVEKDQTSAYPSASAAYSEDGSLLLVSWSRKHRHIHMMDPRSGKLRVSVPNMLTEGHASIATLGRFLLCLSEKFNILDMITLQVIFTMDINPSIGKFLATNYNSNSFAIGLNLVENASAAISIFDIDKIDQGAIHDFEFPGQLHTLQAEQIGRGFVLIDNHCKIRKLLPPGDASIASLEQIEETKLGELDSSKTLGSIFGGERIQSNNINNRQKVIENGDNVNSLGELFSIASTAAQPGVDELFNHVARAISGIQVQVAG